MGTKISIEELYERDKGICGICEARVTPKQLRNGWANRDHIVPASLGGTNHHTNLRLAHYWCNMRRGNGLPNNGQLSWDEKMIAAFEDQNGLCVLCNEGLEVSREKESLVRGATLAHRICIRRSRGM